MAHALGRCHEHEQLTQIRYAISSTHSGTDLRFHPEGLSVSNLILGHGDAPLAGPALRRTQS